MSHTSQIEFVKLFSNLAYKEYVKPALIEIGSHSVNGEMRGLFPYAENYVGLDLCEGSGVDVVSSGHVFGDSKKYDISIACEVFEHNPYWLETFLNMIRITRGGGLVLLTCGSRGRIEHGTTRTDPNQSPGTSSIGWNYYKNLNESDFKVINLQSHFMQYKFYYVHGTSDLYFAGIVKPVIREACEAEDWIKANLTEIEGGIKKIKNSSRRKLKTILRRMPLIILSYLLSDENYQNFSIKYEKYSLNIISTIRGLFKRCVM